MAKNRKPRKPYRKKPVRMPCLADVSRESFVTLLGDVELVIYNTLPTGNAKGHQIEACRTVMNHAMTGMHHRRNALDENECETALEAIYAAGDALAAAVKRHNKEWRKGNQACGFVFKGDELRAIEAGFVVAAEFIKDSLEVCPSACLKELYAAAIIDKEMDAGKIKNGIDAEYVDAVIARLDRAPTSLWRHMAGME